MSFSKQAFTLLELIIVIIIVGILATVGLNQYNAIIKKGRAAEAKSNINLMRKLAYEYYLKNGTTLNLANSDVSIGSGSSQLPSACRSSHYFYYTTTDYESYVRLYAYRCTAGGKSPNAEIRYYFRVNYYPNTGAQTWICYDYGTAANFPCP